MVRRLVVLLLAVTTVLTGMPTGPAMAQTRICSASGIGDPAEGGRLDIAGYAAAWLCDDDRLQFAFQTHDEWDLADFNELFIRLDTDGDTTNGCSEGDFLAYGINRGSDILAGVFVTTSCDDVEAIGLAEVTTTTTSISIAFDRSLLGDGDVIGHYGLLSDHGDEAAADRAPDQGRTLLALGPLDDPESVGVCVADPVGDVVRRDGDVEQPTTQPAVDLTQACARYGSGLQVDVRLPAMDFAALGAGSGPVVLIDTDDDDNADRLVRAIWNGSSFVAEVTDRQNAVVCTAEVRVVGDRLGIGNLSPDCVGGVARIGFSAAMGARSADGAAFVDRAGPAVFTPIRRAAPWDPDFRGLEPSSAGVPHPGDRPPDRGLTRVAGPARIETSIAASLDAWPDGAASAVLARQDVEADALAGAALATALHAPLLLTPTEGLTDGVAAELRRLLPAGARVYALGGSAAISSRVLADVQQLGLGVVRLSGASRVETGLAIAEEAATFLDTVDHILVADAFSFQWALMAGAAAGAHNGVVVTTAESGLSPEARAFIADHPAASLTAVGPAATSAAPEARSLNGDDVYDTSVLVAEAFFPDAGRAAVASGENFPDGLSGGAFSGSIGMPLLLSPQAALPAAVEDHLSAGAYDEIYLFGGTAALSQDVETALRRFIG